MSDHDWNGADGDVIESLRAEESGASADAKEHVFQRLAVSLGAPPAASPATEVSAPLGRALGRPWVPGLAFVLGAGIGAATYATLVRPSSPRIVYVDRVVTEPPPTVAPAPPASASDESTEALRRDVRRAPSLAKSNGLADLAAQQALLDAARASFGRGENEATLRTLAVHERRYPDSALIEEREALAIKALVASGKLADARARGARFAERHPRSLLLPAVQDALGSIP